jgi:hypothetical protein
MYLQFYATATPFIRKFCKEYQQLIHWKILNAQNTKASKKILTENVLK